MSANLNLGPGALLLIRESQLHRFRNLDLGPSATLIVLPDALPENWALQLANALTENRRSIADATTARSAPPRASS